MAVMCLLGVPVLGGQGRYPVRWLGVKDTRASVELRYESESQERKAKGLADDTLEEDWSFRKIFDFGLRGYVYHPRFLDFDADVGLDIEEGETLLETPTGRREDSRSQRSPLYDLSGQVLSERPVSLWFQLRKARSTFRPAFGEVAVVDSQHEEVHVRVKRGPLPTRFFFSHSTDLEDERGLGEDRDRERTAWGFVTEHREGPSSSRLSYERRVQTEELTNVSDVESWFRIERQVHDVVFENQLALTPSGESHLRSRAMYADETGSFPSNRLRMNETLHLAHTERFSTDYALGYSQETVGDSETEIFSERASLSHKLFESLFTTADLRASQESFDGSGRDIYGGATAVTYRKRIPWGRLTVGLGLGSEITDEKGGMGVRTMLDERHALSGTATTLLKEPDVVEGTIVLTDAAGTRTYVRDTDYRVLSRGDRTELRRIASGSIPSGSTVLVDYSFLLPTPITYENRDRRARVQVDLFDHLTLYASRRSTTQDLLSGIDENNRLEDIHDTVYGARLQFEPATLTAEHQIYDSDRSPFTSDTIRLDVSQPIGRYQRIGASAAYRYVTFGDETAPGGEDEAAEVAFEPAAAEGEDESSARSFSGSYSLTLPGWPSLRVTAGKEQERDRGFSGDYFFYEAQINYHIRKTRISLSYRANRRDDDFALEDSRYFFLSIRREF